MKIMLKQTQREHQCSYSYGCTEKMLLGGEET